MITKLHTATLQGLDALPIIVEVGNYEAGQISRFNIVGLPDNAVRESHERVMSALRVNGYKLPYKSIVINLTPADVRKEGSGFDLPIALGLMISFGMIKNNDLGRYMFLGELGLDGQILPVKGALPVSIKARELGYDALFVPIENAREAAVVNKLKVYGVSNLKEVASFLNGETELTPTVVNTREEFYSQAETFDFDFNEVKGQENVKRAFEVAAAGGHHILLVGNPGCGKSMMAKRLPSILPPLTLAESLETTQIHSIAGKLHKGTSLISQRPFRAPHHTISDVGLTGGNSNFNPGEISLAHNGVLFLDELPEFSKHALETMRQPLEDHCITISRAKYSITLPSSFMLVASMNPCPCGYNHHPTRKCTCTQSQIIRYLSKVSGPLLDRIDIVTECDNVDIDDLTDSRKGEPSAVIRERVIKARHIQTERFKGCKDVHCNAQMTPALMEKYAPLTDECSSLLKNAMKRLDLSARAYDRIVKVARTIADLDGSQHIQTHHIAEAVGYRSMDRSNWFEN